MHPFEYLPEMSRPTTARKGNYFLTFWRGVLGFISLEYAPPLFFFFWSNIVTKHFHLVQNVCFLLSGEFSFPLFIYFTFYPLVHFLSMDVCVRGCQRVCVPVRIGECQVQMSVFGVTLYYSFKLSFITFLYLCVMGT